MTIAPRGLWARIPHEVDGARFLVRNLRFARGIPSVPTIRFHEFTLAGARRADVDGVRRLHKALRDGIDLNVWRRELYALRGRSLLVVTKDSMDRIVGFEMFYARSGEHEARTVHEAFIGVAEEFRGRGLAQQMRSLAITHFANGGLSGISSSIMAENAASVGSALRCGFKIVSESVGLDGQVSLSLFRPLHSASEFAEQGDA